MCRMPTHKYSQVMSQKTEREPIGIFKLDPASNYGLILS